MTSAPSAARVLAGGYRIDGRIARGGGMGEVFHGYDERLDRPVEIKMLRQPTAHSGDDRPEALELLEAQRRVVQLRYHVHHAVRDDERLLDTQFVIAQLLSPPRACPTTHAPSWSSSGPRSSNAMGPSQCMSATWTGRPTGSGTALRRADRRRIG